MSEENKNPLIEAVLKLHEFKNPGYGSSLKGAGDPYQGKAMQPYMNKADIPTSLRAKETPAAKTAGVAAAAKPAAASTVPKATTGVNVVPTSAPPPQFDDGLSRTAPNAAAAYAAKKLPVASSSTEDAAKKIQDTATAAVNTAGEYVDSGVEKLQRGVESGKKYAKDKYREFLDWLKTEQYTNEEPKKILNNSTEFEYEKKNPLISKSVMKLNELVGGTAQDMIPMNQRIKNAELASKNREFQINRPSDRKDRPEDGVGQGSGGQPSTMKIVPPRPAMDTAPQPQIAPDAQGTSSFSGMPKTSQGSTSPEGFIKRMSGVEKANPISAPGKLEGGNLKFGSRGDSVKDLQSMLIRSGAKITADGIFGDKTAAALKAMQQSAGLKADAVYGKQTASYVDRKNALSKLRGENPIGAKKMELGFRDGDDDEKLTSYNAADKASPNVDPGYNSVRGRANSTKSALLDREVAAYDREAAADKAKEIARKELKFKQGIREDSTMTNKLIDSFLQLQAMKSGNIFEAAKKIKKLDPVGKEDDDIDNDGDKDKSDGYLHNRRKKIASAMEAVDPNAEGIAKYKEKAPIMVPKPDYPTSKPGPTRELKGSLPKGVTVKGNTNEEVEQIDEAAVPQKHREAMRKAYGPGRITVSNGMIHHEDKYGETNSHKYDPKKNQPIGQHLGTITVQEEVEQIDEALSADHKSAIKAHIRGMWGRGEVAFGSQGGREFVSHSDGIQKHVCSIHMKKGVPHVTHFLSMDEEVEVGMDEDYDFKKAGLSRLQKDMAKKDMKSKSPAVRQFGKTFNKTANRTAKQAVTGMGEEVTFSEAELEHIAAILEGPVAPTPSGYEVKAFGSSTSRSGTLTDETDAKLVKKKSMKEDSENLEEGRGKGSGAGRPKDSKSGSRYGEGQSAGTPHPIDQIKNASARGIADGKGNYMIKHPISGETRAVPMKSANDMYREYHNQSSPAGKNKVLSGFYNRHGFTNTEAEKSHSEDPKKSARIEPKKTGITLASMPRPKS